MLAPEVIERPPRETARARRAWADYVALGPDRSLAKLLEGYQTSPKPAPTTSLTRLKIWSRIYGWQARLQALADQEAAEAEAAQRTYLRSILETGFGLSHERVKALKALAEKLYSDLMEGDRLWLPDQKGIGHGKHFQVVDIERFNAGEVEQLRGLLDDLAQETGGRPRHLKVDIESRVRSMAAQLGLDPDAAVEEAQRLLRQPGRSGWSGS